jgi:tetratricopeptide (TPR) repeat protein
MSPHPSKAIFVALLLLQFRLYPDALSSVQQGKQLLSEKKYDEALQQFGAALKEDSKNAEAYKGAGYAYVYKGDKVHALQYLKYSIQLNPADGQLSQYVSQLEGSKASAANSSDQAMQNGMKYLQSKQYPYAAYCFDQATKSDPNNAKAWQALGNAFYGQSLKDKALAAWEKAVTLEPSNVQLSQYMATIKGNAVSATAEVSNSSAENTKKIAINPWIMGGTVVALGAVMLFIF